MGAVEESLLRQGLRYALGLRLIVVALSSTASLLLTEAPRQGVTVAVVAGLNGWNLWYARELLRGTRTAGWIVADIAVMCAVCLTQLWTVRSDPRGGGTWVLIAMVITVVTYAWQMPWPALAAGTSAIIAAHYAGAMIADPGGWLVSEAVVAWTAAEVALSWALYRFVRRSARTADRTIERGQEMRRTAAVATARRADEREYLAALHDTASVTLLMIGNGVLTEREAWLAEQARRDLREIGRSDAGHHGELDLIGLLREVAAQTPLRVSWRTPESLALPAVDAVSLSRGVREALTNVVRHAGVDHAEISVRRDAAGVTVDIADEGAGFDPGLVAPDRHGVTRSLRERMARRGGEARIVSSPGGGTTVTLRCPLSEPEVPGDEGLIAAGFQRGLRWAVVLVSLAILVLLDLPHLLTGREAYTQLGAQFAAWAGLLGTTLVAAVATWRDRPVKRWPLLAVVLVCSVVATATVRPEYRLGPAHWSEGDAGWQVVLILLDSRVAVLAAVLGAQYLLTFAQAAADGQAALSVAGVVNATWLVLAFQLAVGMIAAVLRGLAVSSAQVVRAAEQLRTSEEVARQLHRDRERRYADLATTAVPLLEGLADGKLDPAEQAVREECAAEAARMRRLLTEYSTVPDPLVSELRACIERAERRGTPVSFAEYGTRPELPPRALRRLTEPAVEALATARGKVRLTIAGTGDAVTVSVIARCAPPPEVPDGDGVRRSTVLDGDRWWIQSVWREAP
ncbi:signal transduction histidine kinase [Pseudosporangium ferrugineum]|uniref:Signal transduction histidine kinase n=2 Tax=Pseudosporangium ferrugineum TaxID=439699 RepID=A0A2T0S428_9ACTN|nr:signal transduction histidine kinase [Pseudosporangium ferrugineum]